MVQADNVSALAAYQILQIVNISKRALNEGLLMLFLSAFLKLRAIVKPCGKLI